MEAETLTLAELEAPKSRNALRSIKVALLLSRLKPSSATRRLTAAADRRDASTEKEEELKREIGDLKMEVLRERQMNKRLRLCVVMEMFLEAAVMFGVSGFLFGIAVGHGGSSAGSY